MNKPKKIIAFTRYSRMGASSRLRTYQYIPKLEEAGYQVKVFPLFDDEYLEKMYRSQQKPRRLIMYSYVRRMLQVYKAVKADLVWLEKEMFPFLPAFAEKLLEYIGTPVVVDYDDAIFHNYDRNSNIFIRKILGAKIAHVMKAADCVLSGNNYLADYAKKANSQVVQTLPTVVDTTRYEVKNPEITELNDAPVVIGWIGSPTTLRYLEQLLPVIEKLSKVYNIQIKVVGGVLTSDFDGEVIHEAWSEKTETNSVRSFDIGVMPLEKDDWEKGKCAYKLIQYMACAVPAVATKYGANIDVIQHGKTGFLASSNEDWYNYLEKLIVDKSLRVSMGTAGRKRVEKYYSLKNASITLIEEFNRLTKNKTLAH